MDFLYLLPLCFAIVAVGGYGFYKHATRHTDGTDDIRDATNAQKGLMTAAQVTELEAVPGATDLATFDRVLAKNFTSKFRFTLADDTVTTFDPPNADRYFFLVTTSEGKYYFGFCAYDSSYTFQNLGFVKLDGVLSGTTGDDGNFSIGVNLGTLYIENRKGASHYITIAIIGGGIS